MKKITRNVSIIGKLNEWGDLELNADTDATDGGLFSDTSEEWCGDENAYHEMMFNR